MHMSIFVVEVLGKEQCVVAFVGCSCFFCDFFFFFFFFFLSFFLSNFFHERCTFVGIR